jgi:hypothetical protein
MDCDRLVTVFERIVELVRSSIDPQTCWADVLEIAGQRSSALLASLDFPTDIASLASQVEGVVAVDPIPSEVTFLWFGLFDLRTGDEEGFYISGGTGTNPDRDQRRIYWPEGRYLTSRVLDAIKATIMQVERSARHKGKELSDEYCLLDYAIMFGAAALFTRFVVRALTIRLPVYVGFDSGDWALVENTPSDAAGDNWPVIPVRLV